MNHQSTRGHVFSARKFRFLALLAGSSVLTGWTSQAFADDSAAIHKLEAEIHRIEARHQQEIHALQAEIHHLRRQGHHDLYVTKGEPVPEGPGPHVIESAKGPVHFGFSDADGENTVELTGQLDIDAGGYAGYHPYSSASPKGLASGINFRHVRIGVQGHFLGDWAYLLRYDLGGNSDGYGGSVTGGATSGIENAFITYNGLYKHGGPFPVAFTLGAIDVPWTLDEPMGSTSILFMERPSSQVIATAFGGGDSRTSLGFNSNNDRYWLGAFLTGPTTGALHTVSSTAPYLGPQFSALGRATYNIFQDKATNGSLHVGVNVADLFAPRGSTNAETITLADRPELRIDPTQILTSGAIAAHGGQVFGGEAAATYGNAFVQGEFYHYIVDTKTGTGPAATNGPSVSFNGGYVQGSYTFGGRRYYKPTTGAYSDVIPDRPFVLGTDGWGALEVSGRFDIVDLNGLDSLREGGYLLGGKQTSFGAGLSWYPNNNVRFILDYEHVIDDTPVFQSLNKGATIDWIAARSQVIF